MGNGEWGIGYWLLVIGYWLLVIYYQLAISNYSPGRINSICRVCNAHLTITEHK